MTRKAKARQNVGPLSRKEFKASLPTWAKPKEHEGGFMVNDIVECTLPNNVIILGRIQSLEPLRIATVHGVVTDFTFKDPKRRGLRICKPTAATAGRNLLATPSAPKPRRVAPNPTAIGIGTVGIVNDADRPCTRLVAVITGEVPPPECGPDEEPLREWTVVYLNADSHFDRYLTRPMHISDKSFVRLSDFNMTLILDPESCQYKVVGDPALSRAKYRDGSTRYWQDNSGEILRARKELVPLIQKAVWASTNGQDTTGGAP